MSEYVRISKRKARNLFYKGQTIWLLPCKCRVGDVWIRMYEINLNSLKSADFNDFDSFINNYIYYNCNYELGYYPAYYIKEH